MIKIIFYISILIIFYYCIIRIQENFEADIYDNKNCCVIRKKRIDTHIFNTYKKSNYCDNYHDNYLRTIKEGELIGGVPFDMKQCVNNKKFGSCRKLGGFTCVDFVTKEECLKYPDLVWNTVTCNDNLPYVPNYYEY